MNKNLSIINSIIIECNFIWNKGVDFFSEKCIDS